MTVHVCTFSPAEPGIDVCTSCGAAQPNPTTADVTADITLDDDGLVTCSLEILPDGGRAWRCRTGGCDAHGVEQFLEDAYQAWRRHLLVAHPTAEGRAA